MIPQKKRMAGDYEIIQAVHTTGVGLSWGKIPQDDTGMKYMCAFCRQNRLICRIQRSDGQ